MTADRTTETAIDARGRAPRRLLREVVALAIALGPLAALAACSRTTSERPPASPPSPSEPSMPASVHGSLTLDGAPLPGVEVVLTDATGAALAAQAVDATGGFRFEPGAGFTGGWVVARLHAPIVGAAAREVDAGGTADLALTAKAAATLSLTIAPPAGVPLDWAIVRLSPRGLPGVPDAVVRAAQLVGVGPSIRGTYHEVRVTGPRLDVPVLPGTWGVGVEHIVERSPTDDEPPPDWINDTVVLADGTRVPAEVGESRLSITGDTAATITTRRYDDGVPHGSR